MRLMVVLAGVTGGGAEQVGVQWMRQFEADGYLVSCFTTATPWQSAAKFLPSGVTCYSAKASSRQLGKLSALLRALWKEKPDFVLSLATHPNLLTIVAGRIIFWRRPKVIISEHNIVSIGIRQESLSHFVKVRLARTLYRRADAAIAVSHAVAAELVSWFSVESQNCHVVLNPALDARYTVRRSLNGPVDAPAQLHLICVGRLAKQKRPWLVLEAAVALKLNDVPCCVDFFGSGELEEQLRKQAAQLGVQANFHGWVDDWTAQITPPAVLVLASSKEGLGNVLVEAAASNVPTVAFSAALGVSDAVVVGATGILCRGSTSRDIARAISRARELKPLDLPAEWFEQFTPKHALAELKAIMNSLEEEAR